MAIIEHPTKKFDNKQNRFPFQEGNAYVVQCDACSVMCSKVGSDPGEAGEAAISMGFVTQRSGRLSDPKKWICHSCALKKDTWL